MSYHKPYHWPQIFSEFEQSGLFQSAFFNQYGLIAKYFSLKRSKLKSHPAHKFSKVVVADSVSFQVNDRNRHPILPQAIVIEIGVCKIHYPNTLPVALLGSDGCCAVAKTIRKR